MFKIQEGESVKLVKFYKAKCKTCGTERNAQIGGIANSSVIDRCPKCLDWDIDFIERIPNREIPLLQTTDFRLFRTLAGEKLYVMSDEREFTEAGMNELITLTNNEFQKYKKGES